MTHILIQHKVQNFSKWKPVFDEHNSARQAAGLRVLHVWQKVGDPNDVTMLFEANNLAKAKEFSQSPELQEKMKDAGVVSTPQVTYLEQPK